jgi:hypothetical protein
MTNVFSSVFLYLVIELKGKWSIRQRRRFHSTPSYYLLFAGIPPSLHIGIIFHSYIVCQRGENLKRAHKVSVFGDSCQRGRSIRPKQKDRTTKFLIVFWKILLVLLVYLKLVFLYWEVSQLVYPKTLLKAKRRILFRVSFVWVKGKAFETGGENFKSWKCFFQSYSYTFDYLQKDFEKNFPKNLQKQN